MPPSKLRSQLGVTEGVQLELEAQYGPLPVGGTIDVEFAQCRKPLFVCGAFLKVLLDESYVSLGLMFEERKKQVFFGLKVGVERATRISCIHCYVLDARRFKTIASKNAQC